MRDENGKQEQVFEADVAFKAPLPTTIIYKCDACAHEFEPKPKFTPGDWVVSLGCLHQVKEVRDTGYSMTDGSQVGTVLDLRPAVLSDFEKDCNGVEVLMQATERGTGYILLTINGHHVAQFCGSISPVSYEDGEALARALGVQIAPADLGGEG